VAEIGERLRQPVEQAFLADLVIARELHQQDGFRSPLDEGLDRCPVERHGARKVQQVAVGQLHGGGAKLDDRVRGRDGITERSETADSER